MFICYNLATIRFRINYYLSTVSKFANLCVTCNCYGCMFPFQVLHHTLSLVAIAYTMLSGEGQFYTYMILISETTTPEINMRWFLDTAGLKKSSAYLINGILIFVVWLVARIFLFLYVFYHIYLHYSQIMKMHAFGYYLTLTVPSVLFVMNAMWFMKILKGVMKTLSKWS
uniref:TLC domain-containing protein n=1 Tax=Aegilops tauschii subsp. strangulata TaxID=200361 RepID=A0A453H1P5_AEGTS